MATIKDQGLFENFRTELLRALANEGATTITEVACGKHARRACLSIFGSDFVEAHHAEHYLAFAHPKMPDANYRLARWLYLKYYDLHRVGLICPKNILDIGCSK